MTTWTRTGRRSERLGQVWLRQHGRGERALARVFRDYFQDQARRVARAVSQAGSPSPSLAALVFDLQREHRLLMARLGPPLLRLIVAGAIDTQDSLPALDAPAKAWDSDYQSWLDDYDDVIAEFVPGGLQLPPDVVARIKVAWSELEAAPYWPSIQRETLVRLTDILDDVMISSGQWTERDLSKYIERLLGGSHAKLRAARIARTETTGAMNAGHQASIEAAAESGLIEAKSWLAILDDRVRETHAALSGTRAPVNGDFDVGGNAAPYPGFWGLPAGQRVNCRCVIIAEFGRS